MGSTAFTHLDNKRGQEEPQEETKGTEEYRSPRT